MFTWDPQQGAIKYSLRIDDLQDNFSFTYPNGDCKATNAGDMCIDNLTNNNFQFNLTTGHTYKWWVHAVNSCNVWSQAATVDLSVVKGASPTPSPTNTPPVTPSMTVTPTEEGPSPTTPPTCPLHAKGDANCDGQVDFIDFEIWRQESMGEQNSKNADFNDDVTVDFVDFEVWRQGYFDETPPATPTMSVVPSVLSPIPTATCTPRPACLDEDPACVVDPREGGWICPLGNETPTATPSGI